MNDNDDNCKCLKIIGHLEEVKWLHPPRNIKPSAGHLTVGDWVDDPHIWLRYVESADGTLVDDDVLRSTHTRHWSIHDVQRYFVAEVHCEQALFTNQYPNLRLPTRLGKYFWRFNTATKLPTKLFQSQFLLSMELALKKMKLKQDQVDRLIVSDQLIHLGSCDYLKRQAFFRLLCNILSFQDRLQLVSFENMCCKRLEGVTLIHHLACFNADTLKYLFLWRFVLPNENPILINYSYITVFRMTTDDEKDKLTKLLNGLEVPDIKLTERCSDLIQDFHQKFDKIIEEEESKRIEELPTENPYKVDKNLLEETEKKLRVLMEQNKRSRKQAAESILALETDPKRPWRTHSHRERLLRINNELKYHHEKGLQSVPPLGEKKMKDLISECEEEARTAPPVSVHHLKDTVENARKCLPNFQYRKVDNSSATAILPTAHEVKEN